MCGRRGAYRRESARRRSGEFRGVNIANGEPRAASSSLPLHRAEIDRINSGSELAPSSWKTSPSRLSSSIPRATITGAISFPLSTPTTLCSSADSSLWILSVHPCSSTSVAVSWFCSLVDVPLKFLAYSRRLRRLANERRRYSARERSWRIFKNIGR